MRPFNEDPCRFEINTSNTNERSLSLVCIGKKVLLLDNIHIPLILLFSGKINLLLFGSCLLIVIGSFESINEKNCSTYTISSIFFTSSSKLWYPLY